MLGGGWSRWVWLQARTNLSTPSLPPLRSFFQSVCTLGYCLLPLTLSLILSRVLITVLSSLPRLLLALRLVFIALALVWSTRGEQVPVMVGIEDAGGPHCGHFVLIRAVSSDSRCWRTPPCPNKSSLGLTLGHRSACPDIKAVSI